MHRILLIILLCEIILSRANAQEMSVPVGLQHSLLMKALGFDRSLKTRGGEEIVIGVLYQSKVRSSVQAKNDWMKIALEQTRKLNNTIVRWHLIDLSEVSDLKANLAKNHVAILYVAPIRGVGIEPVVSICRAQKILTMTGVPDFVQEGVAVGICVKGEKPQIEINLAAAKEAGADFASQLLKVARIVE